MDYFELGNILRRETNHSAVSLFAFELAHFH